MRFRVLWGVTVLALTAQAVIALGFLHYPLWIKGLAYLIMTGGLVGSFFLLRGHTVLRYQIVQVVVLTMMLAVVIAFDRTGHKPWAHYMGLSLLAVYFASGPFVYKHD
jgi:hypothetical protein